MLIRILRIFAKFSTRRYAHIPLNFQGRKIMFRQPRDNHRSLETGRRTKIRFLFDLLTFHGIHSHGSRGFLPVLYIYIYTRALHSSAGSSKFRRPCQVESESILPSPLSVPLKRIFPRRMRPRGIHLLFRRNIRVFDTRDASIQATGLIHGVRWITGKAVENFKSDRSRNVFFLKRG